MKHYLLSAAAVAAALALPQGALAEPEVTVGGAFTLGLDDSLDHASTTFEAFVEYGNQGFHAGLWVGSLYQDPTDDFEYELSLGYGGEAGSFFYDVSAIGYFLSDSGYQSTGIGLELGTEFAPGMSGALYVEADTDTGDLVGELSLESAINDKFTVWGMIGTSEADANDYAELGVSYAINDSVGLEAVYEDANDGAAAFSISLVFETGLLGG